jgi:hypothetical protein
MFKLLKEIAAGINAASAIRHGLEPPAAALNQPSKKPAADNGRASAPPARGREQQHRRRAA